MSLRKKTLIIIIVAFVFLSSFLLYTTRTTLLESFLKLEENYTKEAVTRVISAINNNIFNLDLRNKDYASWDETYDFLENKNKDYIDSELTNETFSNLKINMLLIIDTKGNIIIKKGFDLEKLKEVDVSEDINRHIKINNLLLSTEDKEKSITGIILLKEGPMIITSRPILTSNGNGPCRGTMIMGRYLDNKEIEQLNKITEISFNIFKINEIKLPKEKKSVLTSSLDIRTDIITSKENKEILIQPLSNDLVSGYISIKDIYGDPILVLKVDVDRNIYKQGQVSIRYLSIYNLIIGIAFAVIAVIIMQKLVLQRIYKLNNTVNNIRKKEDFSIRVEVKGKDELSSLSSSVNEMLYALENSMNKLKESEEQYKISNDKLKELDKLKTDFLSTVSHELRTPLTSILGFSKIIKRKFEKNITPVIDLKDEKTIKTINQISDNVDIIISEGERLTAIINDVLDIAKMEAGKVDWKMEEINIEEIIDRSTNATSSLFKDKGLSIIKQVEKDLPMVVGDKNKLMQVLINLLSNSVKFTDDGAVTCKAHKKDNEIIVTIIDTGMGINSSEYENIFEKFKQVGDTLINKPKGTGLGLPICKSIIEYHGGKIWVESKEGEGSKFYFSLPLSKNNC